MIKNQFPVGLVRVTFSWYSRFFMGGWPIRGSGWHPLVHCVGHKGANWFDIAQRIMQHNIIRRNVLVWCYHKLASAGYLGIIFEKSSSMFLLFGRQASCRSPRRSFAISHCRKSWRREKEDPETDGMVSSVWEAQFLVRSEKNGPHHELQCHAMGSDSADLHKMINLYPTISEYPMFKAYIFDHFCAILSGVDTRRARVCADIFSSWACNEFCRWPMGDVQRYEINSLVPFGWPSVARWQWFPTLIYYVYINICIFFTRFEGIFNRIYILKHQWRFWFAPFLFIAGSLLLRNTSQDWSHVQHLARSVVTCRIPWILGFFLHANLEACLDEFSGSGKNTKSNNSWNIVYIFESIVVALYEFDFAMDSYSSPTHCLRNSPHPPMQMLSWHANHWISPSRGWKLKWQPWSSLAERMLRMLVSVQGPEFGTCWRFVVPQMVLQKVVYEYTMVWRVFAELRHMIAVVSSGVRSRLVKSTDCLLLYASCTFLAMCLKYVHILTDTQHACTWSVYVSICLCVCLAICLFNNLSIYLSICLSAYLSVWDRRNIDFCSTDMEVGIDVDIRIYIYICIHTYT